MVMMKVGKWEGIPNRCSVGIPEAYCKKQKQLESKGNTSAVSSLAQPQVPGQWPAVPNVVVSRASRHEVVDAHGAQLSNAMHSVLSLHQHL